MKVPISVKLQVQKGWTCTEGWRDRAWRSYVKVPISVKLQVQKGWTCTEGWRERAR